METICPTCGKVLNGATLLYGYYWKCSQCEEDKTDVLHCERGSRVVACYFENGSRYDQEQVQEFLHRGTTYEVESLCIGRSWSEIMLKEVPNKKFNTVHFERCS